VALAALLPIIVALTAVTTGTFQPRYAIATSIGIAIVLGFAVNTFERSTRPAGIALLSLALLGATWAELAAWRTMDPGQMAATHSVLEAVPAGLPIVVASPLVYPTLWWYSPPRLRERLHYLSDLAFAIRQSDPLPELTLVAEQPFIPSKIKAYRAFLAAHPEFYLYCRISRPIPCDDGLTWIKDRLVGDGYALTVVTSETDLLVLVTPKK
jgi:hypothetical protein